MKSFILWVLVVSCSFSVQAAYCKLEKVTKVRDGYSFKEGAYQYKNIVLEEIGPFRVASLDVCNDAALSYGQSFDFTMHVPAKVKTSSLGAVVAPAYDIPLLVRSIYQETVSPEFHAEVWLHQADYSRLESAH